MADYKLLNCDIKDISAYIAPESVDAIITDPPYEKKALPSYEELARCASIVLKPGGSLVVMAGQTYLPEVFQMMTPHMHYNWTISNLTGMHATTSIMCTRRTFNFWKPILWFTKGEYKGNMVRDVIKARTQTHDKAYHKWGQNLTVFIKLVEQFTKPGQVVLDPFNGGGCTGEACLILGRDYIGADNDSKTIDISRIRLDNVSTLNKYYTEV